MSLAAETRAAVRNRPFLFDALRAGVVNYAAAARLLEVGGERDAVAAALRRFAEELPDPGAGGDVTVRMRSGLAPAEDGCLIRVGTTGYAPDGGAFTGVLVTGDPAGGLERALGLLRTHGIEVEAAGAAGDTLVLVVDGRDGPEALRAVEDGLSAGGKGTV